MHRVTELDEWVLDLPLLTDRLELREHRATDLDDLLVFHGDPQVTRYTPWPVRDREATREALDKRIGWTRAGAEGGVISLAVVERGSGTVVGEVMLARRTGGTVEIGYALRADRWGQGLAGEAVARLLVAVAELGVRQVDAVVVRDNEASVRLLGRLGFTRVDDEPVRDEPVHEGAADDEAEHVELLRFRLLG